jgi:hypothetical protein
MVELMGNDSRQNGHHSYRLDADHPTGHRAIHETITSAYRSFCIAKSFMITFYLRKLLYAST